MIESGATFRAVNQVGHTSCHVQLLCNAIVTPPLRRTGGINAISFPVVIRKWWFRVHVGQLPRSLVYCRKSHPSTFFFVTFQMLSPSRIVCVSCSTSLCDSM